MLLNVIFSDFFNRLFTLKNRVRYNLKVKCLQVLRDGGCSIYLVDILFFFYAFRLRYKLVILEYDMNAPITSILNGFYIDNKLNKGMTPSL